jgi:hypothetical protein
LRISNEGLDDSLGEKEVAEKLDLCVPKGGDDGGSSEDPFQVCSSSGLLMMRPATIGLFENAPHVFNASARYRVVAVP